MMRTLFALFLTIGIFIETKAQWSTSNLSQARDYFSATSSGNKVFFAGGELGSSRSNVVDIYDISNDSWTTASLSQARRSIAAVALGNKVFFAGGFLGVSSTDVVDIYDVSNNTWSTAVLSEARNSLAAAAVGTKVFFAGGTNSADLRSNVVDIYDVSTNTWSTATLSVARDDLSATSVGTKVFFAGGNTGGGASNVVDIYDNSTNTWSTATLSAGRFDLRATSAGTKVFFAGGNGGTFKSTRVDVYDNSTGTWSLIMLSQGRDLLSASSLGNQVFFAGGATASAKSNVVDIYDITTSTWSTAALSVARDNLAAASAGNKLLFGGGNDGTVRSSVVDIYTGAVVEPTAQPTNLIFSPVGGRDITLNYTAAVGNPDGYLIVRSEVATPVTIPVDGTVYSGIIGSEEFIDAGNALIITDIDLSESTLYYYTIYAYNGSGTAVNYNTISPLTGSQEAGSYDFYSRQSGNWDDPNTWSNFSSTGLPSSGVPTGSTGQNTTIGSGHTVVATEQIRVSYASLTVETGATLNAANNDFHAWGNITIDGDLINVRELTGFPYITATGPNFFVVNNIVYSGLVLFSDIVSLNGVAPLGSAEPPAEPIEYNNFVIYPCIPPLNSTVASSAVFSNLNGTSMTLSWVNPGAGSNGVMVVARAGGTLVKPLPGTDYTANSIFTQGSQTETGSLNYVVYKGTGNTVTVTGLTPSTVYTFDIYQFNGSNCYNIRTMLESTQNSGINAPPALIFNPLNAATNVSVSGNITITSTEAIRKIDDSPITTSDLATLVELKLTNNAGVPVPFTATIDGTRTIITIDPTADLSSSTVYYVELNPVEDVDNMATVAQNITFTTRDVAPPLVTFTPLNAATNVSTATNITLTFSEAIRNLDNTAISNANVAALLTLKLTNASGANIPFTATIDGTKTIVTIDPTSTLADLSVVYVAVNNVEDNSDNVLTPSPQSITFTTGDSTLPTVAFVPLNAATNVSTTSNITLTFSEAIRNLDNTAITNANVAALLTLKLTNASGANIPFTATIDGTKTIVTIDPTSSLADLSVIYVAVINVEDNSDNALTPSPQSITFTTGDSTLPTVVFTPLNAATNVSTTSNITLTFSEAIRNLDNTAVTNVNVAALLTLKLTNASGANIPFTATIDGTKTIVTIDPTSTLTDLSVIYVAVNNVEDNSDNALTPSPQSITFTTGDSTLPTVAFVPLNAATNVSTTSNITLTFSEAIRNLDNTAITNANVAVLLTLKLTNASGANIPFTATIDGTKTIVTIDPTSTLADLSVIYVAVSGVEDNFNNALTPSPQSITFTTGDSTLPTIAFVPLNAATNVSTTSNITLTFSEAIRNLDNTAITNANVAALLTLKLTNASGANIPFTATIDGTKTIVTIDPTSTLADLSVIYVAVSNVEDNSGNVLSPSPQSITFTTGDLTPPTATLSPLNGAVNVSVTANIQIIFNEPVQRVGGALFTNANAADIFIFKLTNASGANVPFAATINASSTVITIDPTSNLLPNQLYFLRYDVVQDAAGNLSTANNLTFTTQPGPSITSIAPMNVCLGQPVTITGANFGTSMPIVTISSVGVPVTAHTATSITILPAVATSGVVTVTNTDVSISAVSIGILTVSAIPNVFAVTGGGVFCVGSSGVTIGLADSQPGVEYEAYLGAAATGVKATPGGGAFNFAGFFTTAGIYTVKGKNVSNCSNNMSGTAAVQVNSIPAGTGSITSSTTVICQDGSADLNAVGFVNASTYEWSLPASLSTASATSGSSIRVSGDEVPGGTVSVVARNNCGTSNPATLAITVNAKPVVSIETPSVDEQIVNEALQFSAAVNIPVSSYMWSFGDGESSTDESPEYTYTDVGNFIASLIVKTDAGCEGFAQTNLTISEFPSLSTNAIKNVVTANEDGKNDRLIIEDIDRFPNNTVSILDRWGAEVFKQAAYNNDWDFKKGGNYLPAGNYVCIVKLNDSGSVITRTVTLVRK